MTGPGSRTLTVVSSSSFLRAYGGIQYVAEALAGGAVEVRILAPIPAEQMDEARATGLDVRSFTAGGILPRALAVRSFRTLLRFRSLRPGAWLYTDLSFFREAVLMKRLRPRSPLIHYCAELLTADEFPGIPNTSFYGAHAAVPDLVIDLNEERAERRRELFELPGTPLVLPNTLPAAKLPPAAPRGALAALAGGDLPDGLPVLLYAGGAHEGTGFGRLVEALETVRVPFFFLAFCHAEQSGRVAGVRGLVRDRLGGRRARVCDAVPRPALLAAMAEADAGVVYYPYSELPSTNQLYCAPSKLYEYLAAGLPVVGSSNPTLTRVVEERDVGVCATDDSPGALRDAVERLLGDGGQRRERGERARRLFHEELCFERVSGPVLDAIRQLLDTPGQEAAR